MSEKAKTTLNDEKTILITEMQYVHIIDHNTGVINLIEGPSRVQLESHQKLHGSVMSKIVLRSNEYSIILNPLKDGKILESEKEQRKGPTMFSLHPGEVVEGGIRTAIFLGENDGIYISDIKSGAVRLEKGPKQIFMGAYEALYEKELSQTERKALNLRDDYIRHKALIIDLNQDTVIQLYDRENTRIEIGPKRIFLEPFERPKVITISGDTPKRPDVITKSKIRLSSSFISDKITIRTKDNAVLELHVRYKQRFLVDLDNLNKIYLINDFVGFATETLASEIREGAANHNFEDFHTKTYDIIKDLLFPKIDGKRQWRVFENGLEIFSVDIKSITPKDPDIANKLNMAISKNMDIYVQKILQNAELDAKRELIRGEKNLEKIKKDLIELKNDNLRNEQVSKARIDAKADFEIETSKAESEKIILDAKSKSEKDKVEKLITTLQLEGSDKYLRLQELKSIEEIPKSYVLRSDTKIRIPFENKND